MTLLESIPYALFCMAVVFFVLIILLLIIKLFSTIMGLFTGKAAENQTVSELAADEETGPELSCGELKLRNVDEPTAAMIMAIVSEESGIPLEELQFKSITAKN